MIGAGHLPGRVHETLEGRCPAVEAARPLVRGDTREPLRVGREEDIDVDRQHLAHRHGKQSMERRQIDQLVAEQEEATAVLPTKRPYLQALRPQSSHSLVCTNSGQLWMDTTFGLRHSGPSNL